MTLQEKGLFFGVQSIYFLALVQVTPNLHKPGTKISLLHPSGAVGYNIGHVRALNYFGLKKVRKIDLFSSNFLCEKKEDEKQK